MTEKSVVRWDVEPGRGALFINDVAMGEMSRSVDGRWQWKCYRCEVTAESFLATPIGELRSKLVEHVMGCEPEQRPVPRWRKPDPVTGVCVHCHGDGRERLFRPQYGEPLLHLLWAEQNQLQLALNLLRLHRLSRRAGRALSKTETALRVFMVFKRRLERTEFQGIPFEQHDSRTLPRSEV